MIEYKIKYALNEREFICFILADCESKARLKFLSLHGGAAEIEEIVVFKGE